jgi:hypothetical protein
MSKPPDLARMARLAAVGNAAEITALPSNVHQNEKETLISNKEWKMPKGSDVCKRVTKVSC